MIDMPIDLELLLGFAKTRTTEDEPFRGTYIELAQAAGILKECCIAPKEIGTILMTAEDFLVDNDVFFELVSEGDENQVTLWYEGQGA